MENINFNDFQILLKAKNKDTVIKLCQDAFSSEYLNGFSSEILNSTAQVLAITTDESNMLLMALRSIEKKAVYNCCKDIKEINDLFPNDFQKNISDLLSKIIHDNLEKWKQESIEKSVFCPTLVDFDWRVDVISASSVASHLSIPTCFLQFHINEPILHHSQWQKDNDDSNSKKTSLKTVNLELSKQSLNSMLDGLNKIKEQLSSVAQS